MDALSQYILTYQMDWFIFNHAHHAWMQGKKHLFESMQNAFVFHRTPWSMLLAISVIFWEHQQITFFMLSGFFGHSKVEGMWVCRETFSVTEIVIKIILTELNL